MQEHQPIHVEAPGASPVSAIVTAYDRIDQTVVTLHRIADCEPPPAEILVHVDGNQVACADAVRQAFPAVKVLLSAQRIGPGGGRNLLLAAATAPIVASFDDDSYPIDRDYFARVRDVMRRFPHAAIVCARVYHQGELLANASQQASWVADFVGGGCVYRAAAFAAGPRYVPLVVAYGMEESDLALRLHARGERVLFTPWLRVFHDTDRARHADPAVTAASISNQALLTFLRYPITLWPVGFMQSLNRVSWLLRNGRQRGVLQGLANIPRRLWTYRAYRGPVSRRQLRSYHALRRRPVVAERES